MVDIGQLGQNTSYFHRSITDDDHLTALRTTVAEHLAKRWDEFDDGLAEGCGYALSSGGKLLRPLFLLECAAAVGGDIATVLPAAIAAESGHAASLVHDDIIDGDHVRRGIPSVFARYGRDDAIVIGDALIFDLFANLTRCHELGVPGDRVVAAIGVVAGAGIDLCRGQALEAEAHRDRRFDIEFALLVGRLKTASYFRCVCQIGAILGGGRPEWVTALSRFGDELGCAFQIYDDLLGFTSASETTGKPADSDVKNGRLTLPIILAYQRCGPRQRTELENVLFGDVPDAFEFITALVTKTRLNAGEKTALSAGS
jgi:geranylgeranyl diphosphate synthase type I